MSNLSGYITVLTNKIFQLYGSDVYMILCTNDLETLLNIESVFLDPNQTHFQAHVADIEMLQRRVNNELTYNKLNLKKNFFMLPNLNNIKELIRDLINEQDTIQMFNNPIKKVKSKTDLDYNTTEDTIDPDKKTFRDLLKVMPDTK
jgi:hypothetical protein